MVNYSPFQMISIHIIESLVGTVVLYFLFKKLYERSGKKLYFTPLLGVPVVIGLFLVTMNIPLRCISGRQPVHHDDVATGHRGLCGAFV